MVLIEKKKCLSRTEIEDLRNLWNLVYPSGIAHISLEQTVEFINTKENRTHYVIKNAYKMIAWSFTFLRNEQCWISILVDSKHQKKGLGKALIQEMKADNDELCGWMVDKPGYKTLEGKPYKVPLDFYLRLGFVVQENCRFDSDLLNSVKIEWKKK
ncbi:MAG: GNAT family N-acetyltransferase [Lishizhenia sp.]